MGITRMHAVVKEKKKNVMSFVRLRIEVQFLVYCVIREDVSNDDG